MRLSEAIRLGSFAIQNPQAGDSRFCAVGMACVAIGKLDMVSETANYNVIHTQWPWAAECCHFGKYYGHPDDRIWMLFDGHVMGVEEPRMTLEALCDQVRAWEDELAAKGINVEQVTMAAELNQPASPTQSIQESVLEPDVAK